MATDPKDFAKQTAKEYRQALTGVFKAVVPNMKKAARQQVKDFEQSLVTGSGKKIQNDLDGLNKFIDAFDFRIEGLSKNADKLNQVREKLNEEVAKKEEEAAKLREKNIFSEVEIGKNKKTGEIEIRNRLLTEKQINNRKDQIIAEEKKVKQLEKDNLEKFRQFQKGEKQLTKKQQDSLVSEIQNLQERRALIEEEKKLFTGRSGRFDKRIGGFLDDFENALNDKAPDFLIPVVQPLIDIARQVQKTVTLVIDAFSLVGKAIKNLPDTILKIGDGIDRAFMGSINMIKKGFVSFDKGLKGVFDGVAKGFANFRSKGLVGSIKALGTFTKRIVVAGLAALVAFAPFLIAGLKIVAVIGLVIGAFMLIKKAVTFLINNIDVVKERLADFALSIKNSFVFVKDKLVEFAEGISEIPGKIKDFFIDIFTTIKNFFIDVINGVIGLINKIPGVEIEKIKKADVDKVQAEANDGFIEKPDFGESKVDPKLQAAADEKALNEIKGTTGSTETIVNLDEQNNKLNKLIDEFQIKKDNVIQTLPKEFDIRPETLEKDGQPIIVNNTTAPVNTVANTTSQVVTANSSKVVDDTFKNLNRYA